VDHLQELTQIEDPREQWRREQERMLKEYLIVAQEALNAKKEIYQIKQQRFELAQEEYQQLHKMCEDDSRSYASSFSGYSTNTKYDPYQIKAEIASRRDRLSRLKRELTQMKQELQYKEKGVETLQEIDRKMSSTHTNYKLDEAQAIMSELRTIKKAICTGEKERRDLMQSLAKLTDGFRNSFSLTDPLPEFPHNPGVLGDSLPQQFCDAGSQTDIVGEFVFDDKTRLVDRVRLNWQYEEARKRCPESGYFIYLFKKIFLIQSVSRGGAERERGRHRIRSRLQALSCQILLQEKRNCLLMQLEEATRLASYLQSQLKSLSASTLTVSSGSSRGSLASSRGSLASRRGSLSSVPSAGGQGTKPGRPRSPTGEEPAVDSATRLERRARHVSACLSDYSLASDSGVFEPPTKRLEADLLPQQPFHSVTVFVVNFFECLLIFERERERAREHIRVYLPPIDSGTPNTYCSKALGFQASLVFNEIFRIPVHSSMLTLKSLQLYVCSVNQQLQEELLGIAQINLADYDGSGEMQLRWYAVQVFGSSPSCTFCLSSFVRNDIFYFSDATPLPRGFNKLNGGYTERSVRELGRQGKDPQNEKQKRDPGDACSSSAQTSPPHPEPCCVGADPIRGHTFAGQADPYSPEKFQPPPLKVDKETNTEDVFPEEVASLPKERPGRRARGSPFVRSSTIVRSQTFSPGARSQYVCRLYRSDSDSSTLPRKSPFVRNTLERRTLRYKQVCATETDTESRLTLGVIVTKVKRWGLLGGSLPPWPRSQQRLVRPTLLFQTRQTKLDFHQEQAAEKMLRKASKGVCQLRGQNHKEPVQVQTFREKIAFFTRPRINIPPLPADDV
uniref:WWC family member 3 n=1 Tax=Panthera tigris altaica TaxID=74533 RepID=A0A8C9JVE0_PANTA